MVSEPSRVKQLSLTLLCKIGLRLIVQQQLSFLEQLIMLKTLSSPYNVDVLLKMLTSLIMLMVLLMMLQWRASLQMLSLLSSPGQYLVCHYSLIKVSGKIITKYQSQKRTKANKKSGFFKAYLYSTPASVIAYVYIQILKYEQAAGLITDQQRPEAEFMNV